MTHEERYDLIGRLRDADGPSYWKLFYSLPLDTIHDLFSGPECGRLFSQHGYQMKKSTDKDHTCDIRSKDNDVDAS